MVGHPLGLCGPGPRQVGSGWHAEAQLLSCLQTVSHPACCCMAEVHTVVCSGMRQAWSQGLTGSHTVSRLSPPALSASSCHLCLAPRAQLKSCVKTPAYVVTHGSRLLGVSRTCGRTQNSAGKPPYLAAKT